MLTKVARYWATYCKNDIEPQLIWVNNHTKWNRRISDVQLPVVLLGFLETAAPLWQ